MADSHNLVEPTRLILYTTVGCHLCEEAAMLLQKLGQLHHITVDAIEISEDETLVAKYGIHIPVVKNLATDRELGWPFRLEELASLI